MSLLANALAAVVVISVLGAGSAFAKEEPASAEEVSAAQSNMITCAKAAIARLDDGISPANVVGTAAASACHDEVAALFTVNAKGMDRDVYRGFESSWNPDQMFTSFVLSDRVRKKQTGQ